MRRSDNNLHVCVEQNTLIIMAAETADPDRLTLLWPPVHVIGDIVLLITGRPARSAAMPDCVYLMVQSGFFATNGETTDRIKKS